MRTVAILAILCLTALAGCLQGSGDAETDDLAAGKEHLGDTFTTVVPEGEYNFTGPFSRVLTPGPLDILPPQRIDLASEQDGENIEMALWLPDGEGPWPVMLFSSPYFFAADSLTGSRPVDAPSAAVQNLIEQLVPHGYAFATHAVRGTAGSSGCNDLMGPKEIADIDQAVTWLGTQEWSNGHVAMTGVSYDGSTPWSAASTGNPHLKTIIPISGVPDIHGLMYRNGSSELRGPLVLNALYYEIGIESGPAAPQEYAKRILCPEAWEGIALSGVAGVTGSDPTGYWQERNRKAAVLANYQGSVFSVQGLQDWNVDPSQVIPWVDELNATGIKTKQLLGQWGHSWPDSIGDDGERAGPMRADHNEILLRWLDAELKGLDVDTGPAVQVRDDLGRWRNEHHYPPRDTTWTTLHLGDGDRLTDQPGARRTVTLLPNVFEEPPVNPGFVDADANHIDFVLGPVENETLVVGLPKVHVTVTPHGPGGYLAAYLYDREVGGGERLLGWTTMNLAYHDGGTERREVLPGETIQAMMEIQPMDGVVEKAHELVLRLWVFTDGDRLPTLPPSPVDLEIGQGVESVLRLPTVERDESVYFEPPTPPEDE